MKFISAAVGYLFVAFSALAVLDVSVERLLVGAGLAGVVLGIAAQQSLGNIFAGLVLILARPFVVGDHIRIRSGSLGGIFDAWVLEMSLTYVTVRTDDGQLKIPNTAMLAAGVGKTPARGRSRPARPKATSSRHQASHPGSKPVRLRPDSGPTTRARHAHTPAQAAASQPALISNDGGPARRPRARGPAWRSGPRVPKLRPARSPGIRKANDRVPPTSTSGPDGQ